MGNVIIVPHKADAIYNCDDITATSSDANFPVARLTNNQWQNVVWKSGLAADVELVVNLASHFENLSLEEWASLSGGQFPAYWKELSGTGSINRSTDTQVGAPGNYSAKLIGDITWYRDVDVVPGKIYGMRCRLKGDGSNYIRIYVYDIERQQYLTSGGSWQASATAAFSRNTGTWNYESEISFTISAETGIGATKKLRIMIDSTAGATGVLAHDIALYPQVDFSSCHVHNFALAESACKLRASNDNFSSSNVEIATFSINDRRSFYKEFTASLYQWWKIATSLPADRSWHLGRWILASKSSALAREWQWGYRKSRFMPQFRADAETGQRFIANMGDYARRGLNLFFITDDENDIQKAEVSIFEATDYGKFPLVIVPDNTKSQVICGRVENTWDINFEDGPRWEHNLLIQEDPFPIVADTELS